MHYITFAIDLASKILDYAKRDETCQKIAQDFVLDPNDQVGSYIDQFVELFDLIIHKMSIENQRHLIHDILRNNENHKEFCDGIKQFVQQADKTLLDTGKTDSKSARNT